MWKYASIFFALILFWNCKGGDPDFEIDDEDIFFYSAYKPLLMEKTQLRNSFAVEESKPLKKAGKIHIYNDYLFISEPYKGVHIYDNTDASNPKGICFLKILGCADIAVKDSLLYVDSATDLLVIDLTEINKPKLVQVMEDAMPAILPPDGGTLLDKYNSSTWPENTVAVDWELIK